jgi:transposase
MESHLFWFTDEQWAKIEPRLSTNQPGPQRQDDRRILSGISEGCSASAENGAPVLQASPPSHRLRMRNKLLGARKK